MKQTVLSPEDAKKVTGGRPPLVPTEYVEAIQAVIRCQTIDETKYWDTAAEAMAAWAKIHKDKQLELEWSRVKLHAYRRFGELAAIEQPRSSAGRGMGSRPGPVRYLEQNNFNRGEALAARRLARMSPEQFENIVDSPRPLSPQSTVHVGGDNKWTIFARQSNIYACSNALRRHSPVSIARLIARADMSRVAEMAKHMASWFDEFEQHLPKTIDQQ